MRAAHSLFFNMMSKHITASLPERAPERGASLVEMLIVLTIIVATGTWAFMRIVEAQQAARLAAATQELTAYLDKARLDSIRRHSTLVNQMAQVVITSPTSYSITLDSDGDGTLDPPRVFNFQPGGVTFNVAAFPTTIRFNWRGRIVDDNGNPTNTPAAISLQDSRGPGPSINLSAAGDTTTYSNINIANVNLNQAVPNDYGIRQRTQTPQPTPTPTPTP